MLNLPMSDFEAVHLGICLVTNEAEQVLILDRNKSRHFKFSISSCDESFRGYPYYLIYLKPMKI